MKLIVDTNVLMSALIRNSSARRILVHLQAEFIGLNFANEETNKHLDLILRKSKLSKSEFEHLFSFIKSRITYVSDSVVNSKLSEARSVMDSIDPDDAPFLAAALATGACIWSEDKHFQKQKKVKTYTTKELLGLLK